VDPYDLHRFPDDTLHDRLGRAVCRAGVLPRKEFYESWEVARRVARRLRGRPILDLASGHGLVAWMLLLLDPSAPWARCVDQRRPPSADKLRAALLVDWPHLADRVTYQTARLQAAAPPPGALVLGVHACGPLTDRVIDVAVAHHCAVALLPCCHSHRKCDDGGLGAWMDPDLAIDTTRVTRLRAAGYQTWLAHIPAAISPENRLILAEPINGGLEIRDRA
jgi:hypothetical protein